MVNEQVLCVETYYHKLKSISTKKDRLVLNIEQNNESDLQITDWVKSKIRDYVQGSEDQKPIW